MKSELIQHARGSRFFCEAPGGLLFEINTSADAEPRYRAGFETTKLKQAPPWAAHPGICYRIEDIHKNKIACDAIECA